jgi:hypothetical protein
LELLAHHDVEPRRFICGNAIHDRIEQRSAEAPGAIDLAHFFPFFLWQVMDLVELALAFAQVMVALGKP